MVRVVFIGDSNNSRILVLKQINNCIINIIDDNTCLDSKCILELLPNDVIDLFVIEHTIEHNIRKTCSMIRDIKSLKHIPIISLTDNIVHYGCCSDIIVSDNVSDIEFLYQLNTLLKMKLIDDELKKEKILLELKVKDRTNELANKAERLKITLNSIGDGVIVTDHNGKITTMNPVAKKLCGVKDIEYVCKPIGMYFNISFNGEKINIFDIVKKSSGTYFLQDGVILHSMNGKNIRISDSASQMINKNGDMTGIVIVFKDNTKEYEMKKQLIEKQEKYAYMFESMRSGVGVFRASNDGENYFFTDWNTAGEIMEKRKKEDVIGKELYDVFPEFMNIPFKDNLKLVWEYGKPVTMKGIPIKVKGKVIGWRNFYMYKLEFNNEIVCIGDDITETKMYEDKLKREIVRAEESDRLKGIFLANMSHEIRTPMNSILGFSSLIDINTSPDKLQNYINIINESGNLLMTLIDDIIDLSKIQSGSIKIYKEFFNVTDTIINTTDEFNQILINRNKLNINLVLDIDNYICKTYSDSSRIRQVLNNLVGNAIKFTDDGQITYGYEIKDNYIEFFVKDTGIGIEKENIELIFERFTQIDHKQKKRHDGTGLGLTISRAIVELLGGELWVESVVGEGSTFFFTIPIDNTDNLYKKPISTNMRKDVKWNGKKVLVVEDNDVNFKLVSIFLLASNIEIVRVSDSVDFYELIDDSFDIVLMDIHLTDGDGYTLIKHIKSLYNDMSVIVTTAFASKEDEIESYKNGSDYYLTKPLKRNDLIDTMDKYMRK